MISLKHLVIGFLLLGLGSAGTAGAVSRTYSLHAGSGGQLQIGGGLPLPIQPTCNGICTGTKFPALGIPAKPGATVTQTQTMLVGKKLVVPTGVLVRPASFQILGQNINNTALYAVATDLEYSWPLAQATFSTAARVGSTTTVVPAPGGWGTITYSNALGRKFGGPAQFKFALDPAPPPATGGKGLPGNLKTSAAVSLYIIPPLARPAGQAPCTHPAFGGPNPACAALIANLIPSKTMGGGPALAAAGGGQVTSPYTATTVGGTPGAFIGTSMNPPQTRARPGPKPGNGAVKAGNNPQGTISLFAYGTPAPGTMTPTAQGTGITNMASTSGFPWTTGMLTISAPAAIGGAEVWMLTGKDARTGPFGAGVLQMVSGALSTRTNTGDNANRGWVRLVIEGPSEVPALSPAALAVTAGLMLLAAGYAMRRRLSA